MLYLIFRDVNIKQSAVKANPHGQMCTCTRNYRTFARVYSAAGSHSIFSNTNFQRRSFYSQIVTEHIASPLYCYILLLKITLLSFSYRVSVLIPYRLLINRFGAIFRKKAAFSKITRYRKERLIGFGWSKGTSVVVGVSGFVSADIYPFNCNKVPEYLFSISDTSENINFMETLPQVWLCFVYPLLH